MLSEIEQQIITDFWGIFWEFGHFLRKSDLRSAIIYYQIAECVDAKKCSVCFPWPKVSIKPKMSKLERTGFSSSKKNLNFKASMDVEKNAIFRQSRAERETAVE